MAASDAAREIKWLTRLVVDMGLYAASTDPIVFYMDNRGAQDLIQTSLVPNVLGRIYPNLSAPCSANGMALGPLRPLGATDDGAPERSAFVVVSKHPVPFHPSLPAGSAGLVVPHHVGPAAPVALLVLVEAAPLVEPGAKWIHAQQMDHPLRRTTATKEYLPGNISGLIAINRSRSCGFSKEGEIDTAADIKGSDHVRHLHVVGVQIVQE